MVGFFYVLLPRFCPHYLYKKKAMFNCITYMQGLCQSLKLTRETYKFTTVSGIAELEGVLGVS